MNTRVSHALRTTMLSVLLLSVVPVASAAVCDPALSQRAAQRQQEEMQKEAQRAENVWKGHMNQPDWLKDSDGLLTACMSNNWPKIQVNQPMLQKILSGAQERATKEACNRARDAISKQTGKFQDTLRSIPGYENIQGATNNFGSWPQIGDLAGTSLPSSSGLPGVNWGDLGLPGISGPSGQSPVPQANSQPTPQGIPGISPQ